MLSLASSLGTPFSQGDDRRCFFSFADIETFVLACRQPVLQSSYECIAALARGGLYPATMLSHYTGLALVSVSYDRPAQSVTTSLGSPTGSGKLLLVEDVAGKGYTLANTKAALEAKGWQVDVFTLVWDELSRVKPQYGLKMPCGQRFVLPWERGVLHHSFDDARLTTDPDPWVTGFDLDGVFLPDVPDEVYRQDLDTALSLREIQPALPAPSTWVAGSPIITGRLESDRAQTVRWLDEHGVHTERLFMRSALTEDPAQFKASCIHRLSLAEFVESDWQQAHAIARHVPQCVVWHYDCFRRVYQRVG